MGFRSTFTTEDVGIIDWPNWFREKYDKFAYIPKQGTLSAKKESKVNVNSPFANFAEDIQNAIDWDELKIVKSFILVWLHECGGITRVQIEKGCIKYSEPLEWDKTDGISHWHCSGCSDI